MKSDDDPEQIPNVSRLSGMRYCSGGLPLQPNNGDIVAALIDGAESTLKIYSRRDDEITLPPIETEHHSPQTFHADRINIQGVLIEIVRRTTRRKS